MIKNIRHTGITVENIKKALYLYVDLFGFEIIEQKTLKGKYINHLLDLKKLSYIKLKKDNQILEIYKVKNKYPHADFNHIAFTVKNLNETYEKLKKEGIYFLSSPIIDEKEKHKVVFCQDFDENLLELVEEL